MKRGSPCERFVDLCDAGLVALGLSLAIGFFSAALWLDDLRIAVGRKIRSRLKDVDA